MELGVVLWIHRRFWNHTQSTQYVKRKMNMWCLLYNHQLIYLNWNHIKSSYVKSKTRKYISDWGFWLENQESNLVPIVHYTIALPKWAIFNIWSHRKSFEFKRLPKVIYMISRFIRLLRLGEIMHLILKSYKVFWNILKNKTEVVMYF